MNIPRNLSNLKKHYQKALIITKTESYEKYIVYTDNSNDESGKVQVYAATYEEEVGTNEGDSKVNIDGDMKKMKLSEITSEKEWKIIETILGTLQDEIK